MSLKDKLETKRAELADLQSEVESGNAEAVATAKSLMAEIDTLEDSITVAQKSNDILASLKNAEEVSTPTTEIKDAANAAVAMLKDAGWKPGKRLGEIETAEYKAVSFPASVQADDPVHGYGKIEESNQMITLPQKNLIFADLFGAETVSGTAKRILVEKPFVGGFDVVAEGGKKPQMSTTWDTKVIEIKKVAGLIKMTDEFVEDAPYLVSSIRGRLNYELKAKEESELVKDLLATDDLQTYEYDAEEETAFVEAIFHAITLIKVNAKRNANAIVLNPYDYEELRLSKDGNGQYFGGGFFQGEYGNGSLIAAPKIWGVPTFVSESVEQGTVIVGDFKAASVLRKGGVKVAMTDADVDDFEHDIITLRLEERFGLAVYYPAAFCIVTAQDPH